jgi:hypothetical protein
MLARKQAGKKRQAEKESKELCKQKSVLSVGALGIRSCVHYFMVLYAPLKFAHDL